MSFVGTASNYVETLQSCFTKRIFCEVEKLALHLHQARLDGRKVFICGNGGSAANALHIANDLHYGIGSCSNGNELPGIRVEALPSNTALITCLANDKGFENIFSQQLTTKATRGDILIVLSGSGNSPNIVKALEIGKSLHMTSFAVLGYSGGLCYELADIPIHFAINDMQIAEDIQLIVGHICMQWLSRNKPMDFSP